MAFLPIPSNVRPCNVYQLGLHHFDAHPQSEAIAPRIMRVSSSSDSASDRSWKEALPYQAVGETSTTLFKAQNSNSHEGTLHRDLMAYAAVGTHPGPHMPVADQRATKKREQRIVRKRDRKITACTQCRERKLKCDRVHPCSHCQSKGENCFFIKNASDLQKVPKRQVKKRKRAINVCWQCRTRKIPCDRGHPCSHCLEDRLECNYKQFNPGRSDEAGPNGSDTGFSVAVDLKSTVQHPSQNSVQIHGNIQAETPSNSVQDNAPVQRGWQVKENQKYHQVTEHSHQHLQPYSYSPLTIPFPSTYGYSQGWDNGMSFADYHTNDYENEGYGSLTAGVEYQKDNHRTVPDNLNHYRYQDIANQQYSSPYYIHPSRPVTGDNPHNIQSLPPFRDVVKCTSTPYPDHRNVIQCDYTGTQSLKRTSSPYSIGHNALLHKHHGNHNPAGTLPSVVYSSYPLAAQGFPNGNILGMAKGTAHMYG